MLPHSAWESWKRGLCPSPPRHHHFMRVMGESAYMLARNNAPQRTPRIPDARGEIPRQQIASDAVTALRPDTWLVDKAALVSARLPRARAFQDSHDIEMGIHRS